MSAGGEERPVGLANGRRSTHKSRAPPPDGTEMMQTCRQTSTTNRRSSDPERVRRDRCAGGSDEANLRPSAATNPIHHGTCDIETAHREPEGTPRGNRAA